MTQHDAAPLADRLAAAVEIEPMMAHLDEFARWVKLSGSDEEAKSFAYLQSVLDGYGVKTTLLTHEAYISLPGAAALTVGNRQYTCITHSMAQPTGPDGLSAPIIDLGAGAEADFAAHDIAGAIVMLNGMATPAATLRASQAGAAGQIHVSPHEHLHEMCVSPIWGNPGPETAHFLPTTSIVTISAEDGAALREVLAAGPQEARINAEVDTGWRPTPLLVAEIEAPNAPDAPFVLFSGHHDTWYEGVMDNGSANATMLEMARLLAPLKNELKRPLRICFWSGHSHGRYSGSSWYADTHWAELERDCAVHVNVDSTGGIGNDDLTGAPVSAEYAGLVRRVIEEETGQISRGRRMGRNSDQSFWGIGIPSVFSMVSEQLPIEGVRNALGWWWHTPHDTLDKIAPDAQARDTRVYARLFGHLLGDDALPVEISAQLAQLREILADIGPTPAAKDERAGVETAIARLEDALAALPTATGPARDRLMMRLSRRLVPLDYTSGRRHGHDPALPQSPWPSLDPLRRLADAAAGTDDERLARQPALRALAALRSALDAAHEDLTAAAH